LRKVQSLGTTGEFSKKWDVPNAEKPVGSFYF
jgi:hypothetical protein